jgi:hypothetical protein
VYELARELKAVFSDAKAVFFVPAVCRSQAEYLLRPATLDATGVKKQEKL